MNTQVIESDEKIRSSYLEYLPALFRNDEFMGRFLLIFESILRPIENNIDNLALYFDPLLTPDHILPWLASWLDLVLDPSWPEDRRRELVKSAAELYRWRGTRRGLAEYLRIYTGTTPEIAEHTEGMKLGPETRLGTNTILGSSGGGNQFSVTVELDEVSELDISNITAIIEAEKPAHTIYTLNVKGSKSGEER